jgi:taurine transport system permease protein
MALQSETLRPRSAGASGTDGPRRDGVLAIVVGCLSLGVLTLAWQVLVWRDLVDVAFIGSPITVANAAWRLIANDTLYRDVTASAGRVVVGFALSTVVAIPLGLAIGCSRVLKAIFGPIVSIIRPLPSLSWIPLSMMWLGKGESQK